MWAFTVFSANWLGRLLRETEPIILDRHTDIYIYMYNCHIQPYLVSRS